MGTVKLISALAVAVLLGACLVAAPANACGRACASEPVRPVATTKPPVKKSRRGYGDSVNAAGGNIDDYWSPCNSKYWPDYMYCQP